MVVLRSRGTKRIILIIGKFIFLGNILNEVGVENLTLTKHKGSKHGRKNTERKIHNEFV